MTVRWRDTWTPAHRSPRQLVHARVKVLGSLLILLVLVVALAAVLL